MNFYVLTLFPDMVMNGLNTSIIGRAAKAGFLHMEAVNIRDYSTNKHQKVDDYPYGGGAGMLMQAQPVYDAWKSVVERIGKKPRCIYVTPQGTTFSQGAAKEFAREEDLIFLCGHYEGIDERVLEEIVTDYMSIGDYVLTGGELPAMVMIDAISRMVPGVLSNQESGFTESFEGDLLEYPQYSRPEIWQGKSVPKVLVSGNQRKIEEWRLEQAKKRTEERRPDLYLKYEELQKCKELLKKQKLLHMDMTELIERRQAKLLYGDNSNICLKDMVSGAVFLSVEERKAGREILEQVISKEQPELLVLHQEFMPEEAKRYGMEQIMECTQFVYTRKEKLPITGLYRQGEKKEKNDIEIRKLELSQIDAVRSVYKIVDDAEYLKRRIEAGWLFGAFVEDKLAGFIGMHEEGSMGMLEVFPAYRGRHIGKALETYLINLSLDCGFTPFAQVCQGNEVSVRLQESLHLYPAKKNVFFLKR